MVPGVRQGGNNSHDLAFGDGINVITIVLSLGICSSYRKNIIVTQQGPSSPKKKNFNR